MVKNLNISIVLYNSDFAEISNLVKALKENTCINQVYIIDNSPIRNNAFDICDANYIFKGKNIGYGAGHNFAIQKTINNGVKYHLALNPDIIIEADVIDRLLKYLEENNDIGLIMPKIKYPDGQIKVLPFIRTEKLMMLLLS